MNGLLLHSNFSVDSLRSSSPSTGIVSHSTATTESTVRGIGSHSGKFIYAVGTAALRGIEILVILRKLNDIKNVFPHKDGDSDDLTRVYEDTLELARPGIYSLGFVGKHALRAVLLQIGSCQTSRLVKHLLQCSPIESALFLSEIMLCMPDNWLPPTAKPSSAHRDLTASYLSILQPRNANNHPAHPLLKFVLAMSEAGGCNVVLKSGFLDVLLCIYAASFKVNPKDDWPHGTKGRNLILVTGQILLLSLSRLPETQAIISAHPVSVLWPKDRGLRSLYGLGVTQREVVWRELGSEMATRRLQSLVDLVYSPSIRRAEDAFKELTDAYLDVREFARSGSCDLEIAHMAHRLVEELYPFIASSRLGLSKKGFTPQMISEFISGKLRPSNFDPRKSNLRRLQSGGTVVG